MMIEHKSKRFGILILNIDEEDLELYNSRKWTASKIGHSFYFHANFGRKCHKYLHRVIGNAQTSKEKIDHKDGNGLNLQRSNLRKATHQQNIHNSKIPSSNTTGYKGVTVDNRAKKKFFARIVCNGENHFLGYFNTAQEAGLVYQQKANELFGEFARQNINP